MTKTRADLKAQTAASVYLEMRGFKIMERNWQRPRAAVDIIAQKGDTVHFVEVKYSSVDAQDSIITPSRLLQLQRAVWSWIDETKFKGKTIISSVEIAGPNTTVIGFIENVL